jgi:hypothetical protein
MALRDFIDPAAPDEGSFRFGIVTVQINIGEVI